MASIHAFGLIWIAFAFSDCLAISCFSRFGDHRASVSNVSCPISSTHCFLYLQTSMGGSILNVAGGCTSDSSLCSGGYDFCFLCNTDFCNNMTSPRNCYYRAWISSLTDNGTAVSCPGYAYCYSSFNVHYNRFDGGCTFIRSGTNSFYACDTDYCNSLSPSSLSCLLFVGFVGSLSDGHDDSSISSGKNSITCASGITSCFLFSNGQTLQGGCGSCNTNKETCRMCSTNNCNTALPSSIRCFYRSTTLVPFTGPGLAINCHTGITTCRSHTDGLRTYADCGGCESTAHGSCVTCSSNLCNIHLPSNISCYHRQRMYSGFVSEGPLTQCSAGVSTCFTYRNVSLYPYYAYEENAGCGVCNASAPNTISCSVCGSSGCNSAVPYSSPASVVTLPTVTNTNPPSSVAADTINTNLSTSTTQPASCQKKCYYSFGEFEYGKRKKVTCSSCSCFEFSLGSGTTNSFYAGCGNCSTLGGFFTNCRTCYDDYCNSAWALSAEQLTLITANVCSLILVLISKVSV